MPRPDEPYMQHWPNEPEEDGVLEENACQRCFDELGRADPMCPMCGGEPDGLHAA